MFEGFLYQSQDKIYREGRTYNIYEKIIRLEDLHKNINYI